jgi:hypothetical protein
MIAHGTKIAFASRRVGRGCNAFVDRVADFVIDAGCSLLLQYHHVQWVQWAVCVLAPLKNAREPTTSKSKFQETCCDLRSSGMV